MKKYILKRKFCNFAFLENSSQDGHDITFFKTFVCNG